MHNDKRSKQAEKQRVGRSGRVGSAMGYVDSSNSPCKLISDDFSSQRSAAPASQRPSQTPSPGFDHPGDNHTFGKPGSSAPTDRRAPRSSDTPAGHLGRQHAPARR